jgi:hypothetical protein
MNANDGQQSIDNMDEHADHGLLTVDRGLLYRQGKSS